MKMVNEVCKNQTKKRKTHGRLTDVHKKLNLQEQIMGKDCEYRMKYFENVLEDVRNKRK